MLKIRRGPSKEGSSQSRTRSFPRKTLQPSVPSMVSDLLVGAGEGFLQAGQEG